MALTCITIPVEVYAVPKLDEIQRAVLGLAMSFDGNGGLRVGDDGLAAIFGKSRQWVSGRIRDLKDRGFITIEKAHSRHRVIRLLRSPEVPSRSGLLSTPEVYSKAENPQGLLSTPEVDSTVNPRGLHKRKRTMSTLAQSLSPDAGAQSPSPDETFAAFWKVYPRRVGKAAALKSWRKLKPTGDLLDKIMQKAAALARRADAGDFDERKTRRRLQFCPHPATWLNAGRWDDEDDTAGGDGTGAAALTREATDEDLRRLGL